MLFRIALPYLTTVFLVACSSSANAPAAGDADGATDARNDAQNDSGAIRDAAGDTAASCRVVDGEVVHFDTSDGVTLEADLYAEGTPAGPTAILLHMIPPSNDRSNYGSDFIGALQLRGFNVLNVDRRGAGGSGGEAVDAYSGAQGVLDAVAAVAFMGAHPCAPDPSSLVIVGASNGTTTALDYATTASVSDTADPAALVFLTGGMYTENQNNVDTGVIRDLPLLFVFSTAERAWSAAFEPGAAATWAFIEYADGAHGTGVFDAVPESVDDVADWMQDIVGSEAPR